MFFILLKIEMSCNVNNFLSYVFCAQVALAVDEQYKERWTSPGTFNMLASSQGAFIYQKMELPVNYIGCLRKVKRYLY